mgnify:FL=1
MSVLRVTWCLKLLHVRRCNCRLGTYNCDMGSIHLGAIALLSESEGVFTTAQAERMGVPRDALHDAVESGRLERIMRGAYRMIGSGTSYTDGLVAAWKLTAPAKFAHERMRVTEWDGIAVGGSTASSLLGFGDLHLSPYRIYAPKRVNSRNPMVSFAKRLVQRDEVSFIRGLPVTRPERTVFDLVADDEDLSLVADALRDAVHANRDFDCGKLDGFLKGHYGVERGRGIYQELLLESGILDDGEGE